MRHDPAVIEPKWQQVWEEQGVFRAPVGPAELAAKPKYHVLDMFPYPSGAGLHVGHPEGCPGPDVLARLKRRQGYNVLHPMGWDAFGLPAERAAVRENIHPAVITKRNIETFRRQIKRLGFSYDWQREVNTACISMAEAERRASASASCCSRRSLPPMPIAGYPCSASARSRPTDEGR